EKRGYISIGSCGCSGVARSRSLRPIRVQVATNPPSNTHSCRSAVVDGHNPFLRLPQKRTPITTNLSACKLVTQATLLGSCAQSTTDVAIVPRKMMSANHNSIEPQAANCRSY